MKWLKNISGANAYNNTMITHYQDCGGQRKTTQNNNEMDINLNQAKGSGSPPSTSSSYLNIAAFDSMAYPVTGDMYADYYDDSMVGASNTGFPDLANTHDDYYEELNEGDDLPYPSQQIYQHHLQQQYQSTEPSTINTPGTPSIEVKFEDLYDNLNISGGDRSTRRLSSNIHSRRRAQNRASQRAFRERKEQHVRKVEAKLVEVEANYQSLEEKYRATKQELEGLKATKSREPPSGQRVMRNESEQQFGALFEDVFLYNADGSGQAYDSG